MTDNLVFSNMMHRPARTIVSVIGIAIGVLLIVFTIGLANGSLRERANREGNVGAEIMFRASGTLGMSGSESFRIATSKAQELAKVEGVSSAVALAQTAVSATDSLTGIRIIDGVNFDDYSKIANLQIISGRSLGDKGDEAIIDTGWQNQNNLKIGDKISIWDRDFTVVGTYEPAAGGRVKIPIATMQEQLGSEGKCSSILVKIAEGFSLEDVGNKIDATFPGNQIIRTKDLEGIYQQGVPFLNTFLNVIIGIAAAISALVILLTMYTTVTERTRQIGILKALGMSKTGIAWIIAQEALLISFCGVVVGVIFAIFLKIIMNYFTTLEVEIEPQIVAITLIVGLLGGAIGALYPAMRAANLDAVEALSYE
jgi:putative ABC transport system permease protein